MAYKLKYKGKGDKEFPRIAIDCRLKKHDDVILGNKKEIEAQLNNDWVIEKITSEGDENGR